VIRSKAGERCWNGALNTVTNITTGSHPAGKNSYCLAEQRKAGGGKKKGRVWDGSGGSKTEPSSNIFESIRKVCTKDEKRKKLTKLRKLRGPTNSGEKNFWYTGVMAKPKKKKNAI